MRHLRYLRHRSGTVPALRHGGTDRANVRRVPAPDPHLRPLPTARHQARTAACRARGHRSGMDGVRLPGLHHRNTHPKQRPPPGEIRYSMKLMTATEASRNFAAVLDAAERGERIVITRAGRRLAMKTRKEQTPGNRGSPAQPQRHTNDPTRHQPGQTG
ncbi:type II toxin-antitoxin system Phd/YefM family antitoxin [Streptomyces sp. NPDC002845]